MKFNSPPDAEAFWVVAPGRGEIRTEPLAAPGEDEVLVQALYSGVSRGSERLVFEHRVPPSEYESMRAPFQAGNFPAPVKYGYSSVGRVLVGPDSLQGRVVFCLYPHQTWYTVPATAVVLLPDAVPPARAVLAANMETALNAVWDAGALSGDRVTVVGAGVLGCLVAYLLGRMPGTEVQLVDTNAARCAQAAALGVTFCSPEAAEPGRDLVVHTSATAAGLARALELAATEATILELSWFGDRSVSLPLGEAFHARRLVLRSSQVGRVSTRQRSRWDPHRRLSKALELLSDPALEVLIGGETRFADLGSCLARIARGEDSGLCERIVYG